MSWAAEDAWKAGGCWRSSWGTQQCRALGRRAECSWMKCFVTYASKLCFQCVVVLACWQQFRGEAACVACRWVWKQSCGSEQCYGTSGSFCVTGWSCQDNIVSPRGIKKDSEILGFIFFIKESFCLFASQGQENRKQLALIIVNVHGARMRGRGWATTGECCRDENDALV